MCYRLHLVSVLLTCTVVSSVHGPPEKVHGSQKIEALVGGDVILPCFFNITASGDFPTVEWSKKVLEHRTIVFLYRDGCETHEMKNPAFEYRTSFVMRKLKDGDISLRISNVQLSDAGTYKCMRLWKSAPVDITTVELVVGAVSEPKLSVVSSESGGVILQCEANCWLPEPEIDFLDDQGNDIPADISKRERENGSGCYTVKRRMTLQIPTSRVTCRVHRPELNQVRQKEILIPADCLRSCLLHSVITAGATLLLSLICGAAVCFYKRKRKGAMKLPLTKDTEELSTNSGSEKRVLLSQVDSVDNTVIEELKSQVVKLQSEVSEKDNIIKQLQSSSRPQLSPVYFYQCQSTAAWDVNQTSSPQISILPIDLNSKPTVSSNSSLPKPVTVPQGKAPITGVQKQSSYPGVQKMRRNNSSPATLASNAALLCPSSSNTTKKKVGNMCRSMSVSHAEPNPPVAKPRRRNSLMAPSSNNGYTQLGELKEESEQ